MGNGGRTFNEGSMAENTKHPMIGKTVREKMTGLKGTVTAVAQYVTGPDRARVECVDTSGAHFERWFDLEGIEEVEAPTAERPFPGSGDPGDPGTEVPAPKLETTE